MDKAQVVVLTGFLGSGKTTLLRNLISLEQDLSKVAVVLNDFGKISIDGKLLHSPGLEVVEMGSGCICCTLQLDLKSTLTQLTENYAPRLIFIEASGIADPAAINAAIESEPLTHNLQLSKVITVLEADYWDSREAFGNVFFAQLEAADIILFNKIDEFSQDKATECLQGINKAYPGTAVIPTIYCQVEPEILNLKQTSQLRTSRPAGSCTHTHISEILSSPDMDTSGETLSSKGYTTFSYSKNAIFDKDLFVNFLESLPWELFRIKGLVRFPTQTVVVNFVGGKINWTPFEQECEETGMVFIGWGDIDKHKILTQLENCKVN